MPDQADTPVPDSACVIEAVGIEAGKDVASRGVQNIQT